MAIKMLQTLVAQLLHNKGMFVHSTMGDTYINIESFFKFLNLNYYSNINMFLIPIAALSLENFVLFYQKFIYFS